MDIYDDDGRLVKATFHTEFKEQQPTVLFHSSGGSKPNRINAEYNLGLQLVLQRVGLGGGTLLRVELVRTTELVIVDEAAYPIDLIRWTDFPKLQRSIGRGAAPVGRKSESKSEGNRQKQLRMYLQFSAPTPVTLSWLDALISQAPERVSDDEVVTSTDATEGAPPTTRATYARTSTGQGQSRDHLRNRAVEAHAMEIARSYFSSEAGGAWSVANASTERTGHDLRCTRGTDELRVEVKGTIGAGLSVILTKNEVTQAHADPTRSVLFLVYMIEAEEREGQWVCTGGCTRILRNWDPHASGKLEPEQYRYTLPRWSEGE
jgi:hypothetical protein